MPQSPEDIQLRSEEVQEILTAVPVWMIRWGNTLILLLLFGLLAMTWLIKYPDVILAEALITTQLPPQKEYAPSSGKIDTLLVADHQIVAAHTPLAVLENSAHFEDVFLLKSLIDNTVLQGSSFEFPLDELPFLFLGDIATEFALFENSYDQYVLNRRWQPFSTEASANRNKLEELQARLSNLEKQQELNAAELELKEKELERHRLLWKQGLLAVQEYERRQLENLQAQRNYKDRQLLITQIKAEISNAHLSTKNTAMNQSKEEQSLQRKVLQAFHQLQKAILDWERQYVLKSDIAGKVAYLDFWTPNQTVNAGDLVFTIIPENNTEYLARLRSPAHNSGKLKAGQEVHIKLNNYPDAEFGKLSGAIKSVAMVADEEGYYRIDATLTNQLMTTYNREIAFRQEMKGQAEIVTEDLRLMERFFYQFKQILRP